MSVKDLVLNSPKPSLGITDLFVLFTIYLSFAFSASANSILGSIALVRATALSSASNSSLVNILGIILLLGKDPVLGSLLNCIIYSWSPSTIRSILSCSPAIFFRVLSVSKPVVKL